MNRHKGWLALFAGLLTIAASPIGVDSDPASYSLRLPLVTVGEASVQRFSVPREALIVSQSSEMSDMRVFDGNGRIVPMARMPILPPPSRDVMLSAQSILGSGTALDTAGVSLKMDAQGRVRIISVDGKVIGEGTSTIVAGALLDARGQTGDAERLVLNTITPAGQPVTLTVEASEDLKTWRVLGESVALRPAGDASEGGTESISLRGQLFGNTQLRVTWRSDSQLLGPVVIRAATLTLRSAKTERTKLIEAKVPPLVDNYTLEFAMPFATPILAIAIDVKGGEGLLPVRVLGRNTMEEPWDLLGQGSAEPHATAILLSGNTNAMMRIEADRRTSGFASPPLLRFGMKSPEIAFVTSGVSPFTFVAGHASASNNFLPLQAITRSAPAAIPQAKISDADVGALALGPIRRGAASKQSLFLWLVLLGVTALLASIAWHLWTRRSVEEPIKDVESRK